MSTGTVYWITGLSGAGKSTLARALHARLQANQRHALLCDGDTVRKLLLDTPGHDANSRLSIARFNAHLCRFLSQQGTDVVCATISLFHEVQDWNRAQLPRYVEILLDVPMAVLERRDPRGLYRRARAGDLRDVVGVDIAPQWPRAPDLVFDATDQDADSMVDRILTLQRHIDFAINP